VSVYTGEMLAILLAIEEVRSLRTITNFVQILHHPWSVYREIIQIVTDILIEIHQALYRIQMMGNDGYICVGSSTY